MRIFSRASRYFLGLATALSMILSVGPTAAHADEDTIVFGAAVSLTGRYAHEGELTKEGYDFWQNYVNAHGGITVAGKPYKVKILYADDETSPETSARLVEKFISEDHVNFILGPYGSPSSFSAAAVVERHQIPMVEANGASERIFSQGYKYTFAVLSPARMYLTGVIDMALHGNPKPKTVAVVAANDLFSTEVAQGAVDYAKAQGLQVVLFAKYPADATDVSANVSAIKAAHPDLILNGGHLQDALLLQKGFKEQNVQAALYAYSVGPDTPDFRKVLGNDANDVASGSQWSSSVKYHGVPGFISTAPAYAEAFSKEFGHDPNYQNAESSAACLAFQYAIENAGSLDPQKVRDQLANLDVTTFYGPLKFDARGINVSKPMVVVQIQKGELVTVWPAGVASGKPIYPTPPWDQR
ncbi:MAG TPA: amino acid ABC transporter substrate-binding protein [Candidatus Baltobacteraceae bacterium]|jgi:branched-chain amino acid transport system substrate-binding protein|nr:amino acid ABC transporter substrate-binding protein [Candidatus Baltobacteraceae bacterium]